MTNKINDTNEQRKAAVRKAKGANGQAAVNGIDYIEVASDRRTLNVYFIHDLSPQFNGNRNINSPVVLSADNIAIAGGTRITNVQAEFATAFQNILTVRVNTPGDLSAYTLRLIDPVNPSRPPVGFDAQLSQGEFFFRVDDESDFDCQSAAQPSEIPPDLPPINYLAKDYASFRQLILNRLATIMPQWQERNPSDMGIMLVELLAYVGDRLSYYQDAVATEAYLGTARKRVSIRRHARLLDYFMHDGCNARTWVTLEVTPDADGVILPGFSAVDKRPGTRLLTKVNTMSAVLSAQEFDRAINSGALVFETMSDITLYSSHNLIEFYTWGKQEYELPKGATSATVKDSDGSLASQLLSGKVLIFEEIGGTNPNPTHRHTVLLTQVKSNTDSLFNQAVVEITWDVTDALPFSLCVATVVDGKEVKNVSVARGNVVLVDHGRTVSEELLEVPATGNYRPRLTYKPLTHQGTLAQQLASASQTMQWEMRDVRPSIWLQETHNQQTGMASSHWEPQVDLLVSDAFARDFLVETEEDGYAYLRFGDNKLGKHPSGSLQATYRVGNGSIGNVGAEAIAHIVTDIKGVTKVRNPLAAQGGVEPEAIEQVRLHAPQAFRQPLRAVTEEDYATFAQMYPGVQRAIATSRWTGSWYTIFITVDREGGLPIDDSFKRELLDFLEQFRLAGNSLEIDSPRFVPLEIAMKIQVKSGYFRSDVREQLLATFSDGVLSGRRAFFHPDNFTFGQPIYLSEVIKTAMQVTGVESLSVKTFQRLWQPSRNELETGQMTFDRLEIPILKNDPNALENGRISFDMEGGL
jgi:hypothetical protein